MFFKYRPSPEVIEVLGVNVKLITQDYSKPESFVQYGDPIKEFDTNMNFVTIASAQVKDVKIEDYEFTEPMHIFIDYMMHRLIVFDLPPMKLNELIFNISKIYNEISTKLKVEAAICCEGYEFLYLKKIKIHPDNVISLIIEQKIIQKPNKSLKNFINKLFKKKTS